MKKTGLIAVVLPMLISTAYADDITVTVNGENVVFDQAPVIDNDRTLVPMRAIFEAIGAEVEWDNDTRTVTSKKDDTVITLAIGSDEMQVGTETVVLDVPAKIISDRTMVPVRAISEAMDCNVDWEADTRTVVITTMAATAQPEATAVPEATTAPKIPSATSIPVEISDNVNIFDLAWLVEKSEINSATGEVKENANTSATDYISVDGNKSYYAGYYDPDSGTFKANNCVNYAFYDADKKYISGANADMSKLVKAPENASYIRFTIKFAKESRSMKYVTFMQTEQVPTEFTKSEAIADLAQTEMFKSKKIAVVGDEQIQNSGAWTNLVDERLGANVLSTKWIGYLTFTTISNSSLSIEKTLDTFPGDADYMLVGAGYCDWRYSYDIGTEYSNNGGIYDFLTIAKTKWPNTKIIMLTIPPVKYVNDTFTEGGVYNNRGMNTQDYSEQIIEACEKTGTEYIDISQLWSYDEIKQYMIADSLSYKYPNEEGGRLIADKIVERMIEIAQK